MNTLCHLSDVQDLLRDVDDEVKKNRCEYAFSIFDTNPADNYAHRDNADKKVHGKPDVFVQDHILIGIFDEKEREMPERPEDAED